MIAINNGGKTIKVKYYGVEYELLPNEPVDLPEECLKLFFCYNIPKTESIKHWCCERLRMCNPELSQMSDSYIWEEVVKKVDIGETALGKIKRKLKQ